LSGKGGDDRNGVCGGKSLFVGGPRGKVLPLRNLGGTGKKDLGRGHLLQSHLAKAPERWTMSRKLDIHGVRKNFGWLAAENKRHRMKTNRR